MIEFKDFILEEYPKDVPAINIPATIKDVKVLYKFLNKKYFSNRLPKVRLKIAPLAKNFGGKTHVYYNKDGTIKDQLITINKNILKDQNEIINVMAHEMIHIWQYNKVAQTGNRKFADDTFSWFAFGEKNLRGHGNYFQGEMNRLNNFGFTIDITGNANADIDILAPLYGIHLFNDSGSSVYLYATTSLDNNIADIIKQVEAKMGVSFFTDYTTFETKSQFAPQGVRLTKSFKLPRNNVHITSDKAMVIKHIIKSKFTKNIKHGEIVRIPDDIATSGTGESVVSIPNEMIQLMQRIHKFRGQTSFISYFKTAIFNWNKDLMRVRGLKITDPPKPIPEHNITQSIIDYIRNDYDAITDAEIKRSDLFKRTFTDVKWDIRDRVKLNNKLSKKTVEKFKNTYDSEFKDRVDFTRMKLLLKEFLLNKLVKEGKGQIDKGSLQLVLDTLLQGSILENKFLPFKSFNQFLLEFTDTRPATIIAIKQMESKKHTIEKGDIIAVSITEVPSSKTFDITFTNKKGTSVWQYKSKKNAEKDWII